MYFINLVVLLYIFSFVNPAPRTICPMSASLPDPRSLCCGVDTFFVRGFIGGGDNAAIRQYPWLALIEYTNKNYDIITKCGGFLISGKHVVTAAHCVTGNILQKYKPVSVRLGEYDKRSGGPDCVSSSGAYECTDGAISIDINKIIIHPDYTAMKHPRDIALIQLKKIAPFTDFIRPICLPTSDVTVNPPKHLFFNAAGWVAMKRASNDKNSEMFVSPIKLHTDLPFVKKKHCGEIYAKNISDAQICTSSDKKANICTGDLGSPVMYNRDGIYEAVGIVSHSYGKPCNTSGYPSVSIKLYAYRNWLQNNMSS